MEKNYLLQHQLINLASKFSNKTALIINQEQFSYADIYEDCLQLSHYIQTIAHTRGGRVIILSGNSYLTIIAFWSSLICDLVPCIIDPESKPDVLSKLVENTGAKICIYNHLTPEQHAVFSIFSMLHITHLPKKSNLDNKLLVRNVKSTETDLAIIVHTSGSTGDAKGVMLSHRNVIAAVESINGYLKLQSSDVILSVLPMHFDYGLYQILLSFSVGATVVLENSMLFPQVIAQKIVKYKVTVLPCVPHIVQLFYLSSQRYLFDFSSIRMVTNTGENLSIGHIKKIQSLFPLAHIFSMYGLTECKRCSYVPPEMLETKFDSIGIAIPNLEMWVQDSDGNRLGPNVAGELVVSGPTVMIGYWNNPAETALKIFVDPTGKRVLRSGDTVVMDNDGYFYFKGRGDAVLKYKGSKLSCVDMIKKINMLENVNRSYLFVNHDDAVDKELIICIEVDIRKSNYDQLMLAINSQFSSIQKPDHIYITDRFPSLSNGKLDVKTLKQMSADYFYLDELV